MVINDELIQLILEGNKNQFKLILETYYKPIYRYMCKFVTNKEDAKDITQEVFIKVYDQLEKYNSKKSSFKTWLYQVATNYCFDYTQSKYYREHTMSKTLEVDITDYRNPLEALIHSEQIGYIIQSMNNRLSKKHNRILHLYYFAELEVNEISNLLNIPNKTIYSAIDSSLKKIRKELSVHE